MGVLVPVVTTAPGCGPGISSDVPGPARALTDQPRSEDSRRLNADAGMVTFELALAVPMLVLLCVFGAWLIRIGQAQVQLDDATRAAAREVARGAAPVTVQHAAAVVLPGSTVSVRSAGRSVTVDGAFHLRAPVPVLQGLGVHLTSQLRATVERPQ